MLKFREFCVRTVIKVDAPVTSRQNLVKSSTIAMFLSPTFLLGLTTASACVTPTDVDTDEAVSAIEDGSLASTFQIQRAVMLGTVGTGSIGASCTATRISARFALTAAHCQPSVGNLVTFYTTGTTPGPFTATIAQVIPRPGVSVAACHASGDCDDSLGLFADIVLVRLTASTTNDNALTGVQATLAWRYPGEDVLGQKVGAGGHDGNGNPSGLLLQASDTTDSSSDSDGEFYTTHAQTDGGDSGGPFYVSGRVLGTLNGHWWDPAAGYYNNYTSVPRHLDWILSTIGYRWSGQPVQPNTSFSGSVIEEFANSTEHRCQYACEKTSSCQAYAHSVTSVCGLFTNVTGVTTAWGWNGALRHGASSGKSNEVAGYVRSNGLNVVVHEATNSDVHELRLGSNWMAGNLSTTSPPPPAGKLSPYRRSDGVNCVVYRSAGGHIIELALTASGWTANELTSFGGALAVGDPTAYVRSDGVNAVVFRSSNGHINELRLGTESWIPLDLTTAAGSSLVASSDPSAYTRSDGLSSVVFRAGTNVHELFKGPGGGWVLGTPSALAGAPAAADRPFGYTRSNGSNAIVYRSTAGHLIELLLTGSTWSVSDLTAISGNTSVAIGNPTAYVRTDGVESVVFRTNAAVINELTFTNKWQSFNLSSAAGGPMTWSDPSVYVRDDGNNAVVHHGANNHVIELTFMRGGTWLAGDLTNISGETP